MADLVDVLDRVDLVDLAGEGSYFRGVGYAEARRVDLRTVGAGKVEAVVTGAEPYRVVLAASGRRLVWSCTCPVGVTGDFCKHTVAVALTLGAPDHDGPVDPVDPGVRSDAEVDLASYVSSLGTDELTGLVMDQAATDWRLRERLVAGARARLGLDADEAAWRARIDAAFRRQGRFVDYRAAPDWAAGVFDVLDGLAELLGAGHGAVVIPLTERCHRKAQTAVGYVDDSDGYITEIFHRVADLHHQACVAVRPDPVPLARRLAKLELAAELDTWHRAAARYADVLGPPGLAAYRKVVEPRWAALGPERADRFHDDFRIRQAMIGVALASGDPDELIRVKEHDLRSPHDHVEIVEFLRTVGRSDEALSWAQAGLAQFPDRAHQLRPLQDLTADLLRARGERIAAVDVYADAFARQPSVDDYGRLLDAAAGTDAVDVRRRWAHDLVASDARLADVSVAMYLHDRDAEAAWLVASVNGCSRRLWMELARAHEADHPLDVIPIYVEEVEHEIAATKKAGYRRAVKTLAHIEQLAGRAGDPERFRSIVLAVRDRHRQKRSFITLLDQRGWTE